MLGVVCGEGCGIAADATFYSLLVVVYRAVVVEYCLALTCDWDVLEPCGVHFLAGSIVESGRNGAFALENFCARG